MVYSRWARVARGWAAAGFSTVVAAVSHTLAAGTAPSLFGMLVSLVLSASMCTVLTGRTLSLWRLTASVALSQLLFHGLFSGLGLPSSLAAHDLAAHDMSTMTTALDATASHWHGASGMWLAHLTAGLVTIVAFRYAESAFWGMADVARLMLTRLLGLVAAAPVPAARPRICVQTRFLPRDLSLLLSPMRHRGPPAG